jgi:hypothetical protein
LGGWGVSGIGDICSMLQGLQVGGGGSLLQRRIALEKRFVLQRGIIHPYNKLGGNPSGGTLSGTLACRDGSGGAICAAVGYHSPLQQTVSCVGWGLCLQCSAQTELLLLLLLLLYPRFRAWWWLTICTAAVTGWLVPFTYPFPPLLLSQQSHHLLTSLPNFDSCCCCCCCCCCCSGSVRGGG